MSSYPFVYLNHGPLDPASFGKVDCAWIAFDEPTSDLDRAWLVETCPGPLHGYFTADEMIFYCETPGDTYSDEVADGWGAGGWEVDDAAAAAFSTHVEQWVRRVHERVPVAFFVGPGRPTDLTSDPWALWSHQRVPSVVLHWLERYLDTHPDLPVDATRSVIRGVRVNLDLAGEWLVNSMDRSTLGCLFQHLTEDPELYPPTVNDRIGALARRVTDEAPRLS